MVGARIQGNAVEKLLQHIRPLSLATIVSVLIAIHYLYLMVAPHELLVSFVPDDAFYELQIARHHSATGVWSFDRGFTTTTGFHLLNVYLMSWFPTILKDPWLGAKFWMGAGLGLSIVAVFCLTRFVYIWFGPLALLATALLLTAPSFTVLSGGLLEYPYVILVAALYVAALFRTQSKTYPFQLLYLFCLGFLGSLARSDFGGLPLAIFLACLIEVFTGGRNHYLTQSFWGLSGATVGLGVVFLHNYLLASHFLSGSSLAKALWGTRVGYSIVPPLFIALQTFTNSALELVIIAMLFFVVAILRAREPKDLSRIERECRKHLGLSAEQRLLGHSGLIAVCLYLLTYGADPSSQVWYTANFVIPFSLILGTYSRWIGDGLLATGLAYSLVVLCLVPNVFASYRNFWPNQTQMLQMADHFGSYPLNGRVAGWNVGIMGYLLDGRITNLDGLMNDQVYSYMRDHNVLQYVEKVPVAYIVDYPFQLSDQRLSKMGGYDDRLRKHLHIVYTAVGGDSGGPWVNYTLYKFDRNATK